MSDSDEILRRLAEVEARNRDLEDQVAALRRAAEPPVARAPREVLGQGPRSPLGDAVGVNYAGMPDASMTGGGRSFGSTWRTLPNGERIWCPDGVPRDPRSGEALATRAAPLPADALPVRTSAHQAAVEAADRLFPIVPHRTED